MKTLELRQLQYFVEVAKREHISQAADHLNVAQSAVSRQIANLEAELGAPLFERIGRNVKLTPIGKTFLEHTITALKAIDFAAKQVEEHLNPEKGTIKIGFPTSLASYILPNVISAFKKEYPEISFHLRQGSYKFLIDAVKNRELNLAFLGPLPPKDESIVPTVLFSERFYALLPANHPFAQNEQLYLNDMREENFVLFPEGFILNKVAVDACKAAGFAPKITSEGEDLDALKGLVAAGVGITLLPESSLYDTIPRYTAKVPIASPSITRSVGIISPSNREIAPSEQVFLNFVTKFFFNLSKFL